MQREMLADIKGYNGFYKISTEGNVYSPNGKIKEQLSNTGYLRVSLWKNGKCKHFSIHRLMAEAFIPNPKHYRIVNHIDGVKTNNTLKNLEWCDASMNISHAYKTGLIKPKTTRIIQYSMDMRKIKEWNSINEACKSLGLNHANIVTVCGGKTKRKQAGGFIWRYANDL